MQIAQHKRGVLVFRVLTLAPGNEPVLETLLINSTVRRQNTPDPQGVLGL